MRGWGSAALGAVLVAAVSTFGDFVWATWIPRHRPVYGLAHGTLLCLAIGLYLGALVGKPITGAVGGAMAGFLAAGGFYALAPLAGYAAMFVLWMALWAMLAVLNGPVLRETRDVRLTLARGIAAAILSGLAFYAVSGIWLDFNRGGINYPYHFVCWMIAYLPGFAALLLARRAREG